jgi:glutamyl-tRNA reductase
MSAISVGTAEAEQGKAEAFGPLAAERVGIVGAGHLGSVLALALLARDFPRERLFLSTGGERPLENASEGLA